MNTRVHISIEVSDLQKSVEFYSRLFQHEPTKLRDDYANFRLETPQLHLALVHQPSRGKEPGPPEGNNRHYGIELFSKDRLDAWLEKAEAFGLTPRTEENVTCCYATANKFWTQDPDGHQWEFWVKSGEADSMHGMSHPEPKQKVQCCVPGTSC